MIYDIILHEKCPPILWFQCGILFGTYRPFVGCKSWLLFHDTCIKYPCMGSTTGPSALETLVKYVSNTRDVFNTVHRFLLWRCLDIVWLHVCVYNPIAEDVPALNEIRPSADTAGPQFNIKMSSYQYWKSHCGDKTVIRSSSWLQSYTDFVWISFEYWWFLITYMGRWCH